MYNANIFLRQDFLSTELRHIFKNSFRMISNQESCKADNF